MSQFSPKVSIIGCGNVGVRYAYSMIIKGVTRELVLVDSDGKKAEGEAMDLSHGAPYVSPVNIYAGSYPDTADSDLVVIAAGRGQKAGETRIDLIKDNADIFKSIIPRVVKYSPKAIILVAANPVDILSYITYKISGKPSREVIGSGTVLDSARFRYLIGTRCNIDPRSVSAFILGEHGDTKFPLWSKAMTGGIYFKDFCKVCGKENCKSGRETKLDKIFQDVRDSAYKIIERKGETSYAIGLSLTEISKAVLKNENTVLPVSSLLTNYKGVSGVYLSVPAIVNRTGVRQILEVDFDETELAALKHSAQTMRKIIEAAGF